MSVINICVGSRGTGRDRARSSDRDSAYRGGAAVAAADEPAHVPERLETRARGAPDGNAGPDAWRADLDAESQRLTVPRKGQRAAEEAAAAARGEFDARRAGEAMRAAMRAAPAGGSRAPDLHATAVRAAAAEPWWRTQISQQMDHARLEATERLRRQRIATVLAENEQHRRVAVLRAHEMEDEQERTRRREFAKIVLDEEQHSRVREDVIADQRDQVGVYTHAHTHTQIHT